MICAHGRDILGKFPDYPEEEDGGSTLIFKEKTPEELAAELAAKVNCSHFLAQTICSSF